MRTTLTIDPDIERLIARIRKNKGIPLKQIVNEALRLGLSRMEEAQANPPPPPTRSMDLGACKLHNLDDISEALTIGEGEHFQ